MGRFLKRITDIIVSAVALIVLSPVLLLAALAILASMGRPIFFSQVRPGLNRQMFTVVKLRTMLALDPSRGLLSDRDRLTKVGWFLRKTSVDELPQLWNVLRGDMSLVGPRPLLVRYLPYYTEREKLRFTVPPGITGWAQVNGRNSSNWNQRLELDAWYVDHWSFWIDVKILVKTVGKVFSASGVAQDVRSAMLDLDEERAELAGGNLR